MPRASGSTWRIRPIWPGCPTPAWPWAICGVSWEGFQLRQVTEWLGAEPAECFFWATLTGAELELLWVRGRRRWGFEFKRTSSPKVTPSLLTAMEVLKLQKAFIVHAGDRSFPIHERVTAISAARLLDDLPKP